MLPYLLTACSSLALVLECIRASAGGRPIELLRKESLASMPPPQVGQLVYNGLPLQHRVFDCAHARRAGAAYQKCAAMGSARRLLLQRIACRGPLAAELRCFAHPSRRPSAS